MAVAIGSLQDMSQDLISEDNTGVSLLDKRALASNRVAIAPGTAGLKGTENGWM